MNIDDLLRRDAANALPDAGFTGRVLQALPPRRRAAAWWRPLLVMGSAVVGCALAAWLSPSVDSPAAAIAGWLASGTAPTGAMASLALGGALLLSALVVAFDQD